MHAALIGGVHDPTVGWYLVDAWKVLSEVSPPKRVDQFVDKLVKWQKLSFLPNL